MIAAGPLPCTIGHRRSPRLDFGAPIAEWSDAAQSAIQVSSHSFRNQIGALSLSGNGQVVGETDIKPAPETPDADSSGRSRKARRIR